MVMTLWINTPWQSFSLREISFNGNKNETAVRCDFNYMPRLINCRGCNQGNSSAIIICNLILYYLDTILELSKSFCSNILKKP